MLLHNDSTYWRHRRCSCSPVSSRCRPGSATAETEAVSRSGPRDGQACALTVLMRAGGVSVLRKRARAGEEALPCTPVTAPAGSEPWPLFSAPLRTGELGIAGLRKQVKRR